MRWGFVALGGVALVAVLAALPPVGRSAPSGARTVTVRTDVALEKVAGDSLFPFDKPEPGELVFFRVRATSDGPATVRKTELLVGADVCSRAKPAIRGRRGLRCVAVVGILAGHWAVRCLNSQYRREGDSVSVLIGVSASESEDRIWVRAGAKRAPDADSDLVVRGKKDRDEIEIEIGLPFSITKVTLPSVVLANGPRGDLVVEWAGSPTFPVTMVYAPDSCAPSLNCSTPRITFTEKASPLRFAGAVWCAGSLTDSIFFDYSVYLTDANGVRTGKANADFTCRPF